MKKSKGFTLIELLIVVAIIAILAAIAVPNFLEAQVRSKVSRAKTDMRSLATAIESYMVDSNVYFMSRVSTVPSATACFRLTFAQRNDNPAGTAVTGELMNTLTTPIAYITACPPDPFADIKGSQFGYFNRDNRGWILWSFGPDLDQKAGDSELSSGSGNPLAANTADNDVPLTVYDPNYSQPSLTLLTGADGQHAYTYDPTNGTTSPGDIYRVRE